MAKETKTVEGKKSSLGPIIIIVLIALATILGIYAVSQSGDDEPGNDNTNTAANTGQVDDRALELYAKAPVGASPANVLGSENAMVVVEEFADFQCPTCGVVHPKIKEVISMYGSKIKFVFRNYPLQQIHPFAYDAALAAESAGLQGKYWQMQDMIFKNQATWSSQTNAKVNFKEYAQTIGLDMAQYESDLMSMNTKLRVDADIKRGAALNIQSTPTVLINGKPVPFQQVEVATLKQLIDAEFMRINGPAEKQSNESK